MLVRLLAIVILALPVMAQAPRGFFNWWDSPVAKDLNLSEDQSRQIRTVVREYRGKLIDQRAALEKAEMELEDLFGEESLDQRRAGEAVERLITARGDLTRSLSQMGLRLRAVLTPEQYRELQTRRPGQARPGERLKQMQERRLNRRMNKQGQPPPPEKQ